MAAVVTMNSGQCPSKKITFFISLNKHRQQLQNKNRNLICHANTNVRQGCKCWLGLVDELDVINIHILIYIHKTHCNYTSYKGL